MRKELRQAINAYFSQLATINEVANVAERFNVVPRVQQTLETKMQESSAFLQRINVVGVTEQLGAKVGIGVNGPIASRTDTTGNGTRKPRNVTALDETGYRCVQTNFDTAIRYAQLDAWAGFADFQTRVRDAIPAAPGARPDLRRLQRHQLRSDDRPGREPAAAGREQGLAAADARERSGQRDGHGQQDARQGHRGGRTRPPATTPISTPWCSMRSLCWTPGIKKIRASWLWSVAT
jgi:hypothetical protein